MVRTRSTVASALALLLYAVVPGCVADTADSGGTTQGTAAAGSGAGGAGGAGATTGTTATTGAVSTTGAGGGSSFVCAPAADPGSIYTFEAVSFSIDEIDPVSMCQYRDGVMLIINTAAKCGYTPQYEGLEALEAQYKDQGLHVLGFLSNDFNQAGTDEEVEACTDQYGVTFDQFQQLHVKIGADQHPLFGWLTTRPGLEGDVSWNFNKWLVGRDGTLVARWTQSTTPDDPAVIAAIEAELAK